MKRQLLALLLSAAGWHAVAGPAIAQEGVAQPVGVKKPSFDSAGVPIHYVVQGLQDGQPVVLIHGFTSSIDRTWSAVIDGLKKDYRVIALDCRGHGGSGKPHEPTKYGMEEVEDVTRLLDHLKIDKAHIVGYSRGGRIALVFTIHHPERVRSLTLGGCGIPSPVKEKAVRSVAESLEMGRGLEPLAAALLGKNQSRQTPENIKRVSDSMLKGNDPLALAAVLRGTLLQEDLQPTLKQIQSVKVPILDLIGSADPYRADVDELKKLQPSTKVVVIDGAGHFTTHRRAEFVSGIQQFLDEQRQPAKK